MREQRLYRWGVASRAVAAIVGGYWLAALLAAVAAVALPAGRAEATVTGTLLAFVVYPGAVMWVFATGSAARAWLGLAVPCVALAAALWVLTRGAA